jgi:hypothetical protein
MQQYDFLEVKLNSILQYETDMTSKFLISVLLFNNFISHLRKEKYRVFVPVMRQCHSMTYTLNKLYIYVYNIRIYIHTEKDTCTFEHIRMYIHSYIYTYMHTCTYTLVHACMHTYIIHTCIYNTYFHTYVTYMHTYITYTQTQAYMHSYTHTYKHALIHIYIHSYIQTRTYIHA